MSGRRPAGAAAAFVQASGAGMGFDGAAGAVRPSLPPLALVALGLWLSCAVAVTAAPGVPAQTCFAAALGSLSAAAAFGVATAAFRGSRPVRLALGFLLGAALGCAVGLLSGASAQDRAARAAEEPYGDWELTALADASATQYGGMCLVEARAESGETYRLRAYLEEVGDVRYGDVATVRGGVEAAEGESGARLLSQGIVGTIDADAAAFRRPEAANRPLVALRNEALDAILSGPGSDEARGAIAALACGLRAPLDETGVYEAFQASGLAHVIAVSGSHLSLVAGVSACALRGLRAGARTAAVANGALIAAYLVVSGMPVSAVRSAAMAACGLAAVFAGRRGASANALSLVVVSLVAADPPCAASVSFALSAASTAGIVLLSPLFRAWARTCVPRLPAAVRDGAALTCAASVGSVPLSAAVFAQVPLVSLPANLAASPLFGAACSLGLVGALVSAAFPAAAPWALLPALPCAELLVAVARACAAVPFACVPADVGTAPAVACSIILAAALWARWPLPSRRTLLRVAASLAAASVAVACAVPLLAPDEIVALDVGQGDAILVRSAGAAVLVDTGTNDAQLLAALARHGVARLDAVVITHADDDHCGSLSALGRAVEVGRVLLARDALSCACGSCEGLRADAAAVAGSVDGLSAGDRIAVGRFGLEVVWPDAYVEEGGNADSLCLLVTYARGGTEADAWAALLVGDAEAEELAAMVEAGRVGDVDLYKVGHHGSRAALDAETAAAIDPEIAFVSVGADNRYGHPAPETLAALAEVGCEVFRTDLSGDVSCRFSPSRLEVVPMR